MRYDYNTALIVPYMPNFFHKGSCIILTLYEATWVREPTQTPQSSMPAEAYNLVKTRLCLQAVTLKLGMLAADAGALKD